MKKHAQATVLLIVYATIASSQAAIAFENLDFEGTLIDFAGLPTTGEYDPDLENLNDPSHLIPGWGLREESFEGIPVNQPFDTGQIGPHLAGTPMVVLTAHELPVSSTALQGDHSLFLRGDIDGGGRERPIPVAFQTGVVPPNAKSISIQVSEPRPSAGDIADHFSVRFNGHLVEMQLLGDATVETDASYPSNYREINELFESLGLEAPYPPLPRGGLLYVGNVESIAGLSRELAIRPEPEPYIFEENGIEITIYETGSLLFDNIQFSTAPAPGPPVQVPEPGSLWLIPALSLLTVVKRSR